MNQLFIYLDRKILMAATDKLQETHFIKFEKLDQERVRYMRVAENFSGLPPPNGVYEWSPLLESTGQTVTYWKLRLHLLRSKSYTSDRLLHLQHNLKIEDRGYQDLKYVNNQIKQAWKDLRMVQSNAKNIETHI